MLKSAEITHPGFYLKGVIMDHYNLSTSEAAKYIGVSETMLDGFISGREHCSDELASLLSTATGTDPSFWLSV